MQRKKRSSSGGEKPSTIVYNDCEIVKHAKNYAELPHRYVLHFPYSTGPFRSYGVIAYSQRTHRWLLVKRRHSAQFIMLVRGSFRIAEIPRLLSSMTVSEIARLRHVVANMDAFPRLFHSTIIGNAIDRAYARARFEDAHDFLQYHLQLAKGLPDTEWLWPKGRSKTPREPNRSSAIREFQEETGLLITHQILASDHPIEENYTNAGGLSYSVLYWVYIFSDEPPLPSLGDTNAPGEIGDRRWVSEDEARALLAPAKFSLLEQAMQQIKYVHSTGPKSPRK